MCQFSPIIAIVIIGEIYCVESMVGLVCFVDVCTSDENTVPIKAIAIIGTLLIFKQRYEGGADVEGSCASINPMIKECPLVSF